MPWVISDKTKSGYAVVVDAPEDLLETLCIKKDTVVQDAMPDGEGWTSSQTTEIVEGGSCSDDKYMADGYVAEGYTKGSSEADCELYVASGYVASGYVEGGSGTHEVVITTWARWLQDPVGMPYVRDGFFDEETNAIPCVPYELDSELFDDIYSLFPFGDTTAAVLTGDNISALFGLAMPIDKRKEKGLRALDREGE